MNQNDFIEKILNIQSKSQYYSTFYLCLTSGEFYNSNINILPNSFSFSDESVLKIIYNNIAAIRQEDREIYNFIYNQIFGEDIKYYINDKPIEFSLNIATNDNTYDKYNFIINVFASDDTIELVGHIYNNTGIEMNSSQIEDSVYTKDNGKLFNSYIQSQIDCRGSKKYAIIQMDIEKFKIINEVYGESFGDEVLNYINNCLKILIRNNKSFARLNSDIFVILQEYTDMDELILKIKLWDKRLNQYGGVKYKLNWGVNIIEDYTYSPRSLIDSASLARQSVKGNALNNIGFYEDFQKEELKRIKDIEGKMVSALENHEFKMFIQPKYEISTNKIIGGESLVRWVNSDGVIIPPNSFIPIFEKNGFIVNIDKYMWEEACITLKSWKDKGIPVVPLSINVSRKHLDNTDFIVFLDSLIEKYNIDKSWLEIEITETLDSECNCDAFFKLKSKGYKLLMDDFGSGYSSLNTLKNTDFDTIKIDKEFLSEFMVNSRGQKIIRHTIAMINDINLGIIAEGVETLEQADFLKKSGCDFAQGYLYAKPMPVNQFEDLIVANSSSDRGGD